MSHTRLWNPGWFAPLLLVLVACGRESAQHVPLAWQIDFRSVGPLRIGMAVTEASAMLGEHLVVPRADSMCQWSEVRPSKSPHGLWLTVSRDTIVRIDVDSAGVATVDGLQVGSTVEDLLQKYDTLIERDMSLGGEPKFVLASKEPERAFLIIYRSDGAHVTHITSGRRSAAQVEECA